MEISQLNVNIHISCSNPYPYGCRDIPGQYIISQGQIKAGFELALIHQSTTSRNAFRLKRLTPCQSVCPRSCKMVIHGNFAQLNHYLHVFDIVQPYQSYLVHLSEDLRLLTFLYAFVWLNYGLNVLNITHTYRCGNTCFYVELGHYLWLT